MADDLHKIEVAGEYIAILPGNSYVGFEPQHRRAMVRVAISDDRPAPDHELYHHAKPMNFASHDQIPSGFTVWMRSDDPDTPVNVIARSIA